MNLLGAPFKRPPDSPSNTGQMTKVTAKSKVSLTDETHCIMCKNVVFSSYANMTLCSVELLLI